MSLKLNSPRSNSNKHQKAVSVTIAHWFMARKENEIYSPGTQQIFIGISILNIHASLLFHFKYLLWVLWRGKKEHFPLERPDYMFWFNVNGKFPFFELAFILFINLLTSCTAWDWTQELLCPDFYAAPLYFLFPLLYLLQKRLEGMWNRTISQQKKPDAIVLPITLWDRRGQVCPHWDWWLVTVGITLSIQCSLTRALIFSVLHNFSLNPFIAVI